MIKFSMKNSDPIFYTAIKFNEVFLYSVPNFISRELRSEGRIISVRLNDVKISMKTLVKGFTI